MEQMPGHRILGDRYEMTRRIDQCGETIVYLGRDAVSGRMVTVRDFCPSPIMRQDARGQILVQPGCEVQYKSLSSDYEELCRYLMGLPAELPFVRPFELIRQNGTVYSVEWYAGAETLGDHLARIGRPIGWNTLKKMLTPMVRAMDRIHTDGIYHRGISAETLLITEREELLLSGFCIPAARTADSEIAATLYFGYSAPEQYSSNSWQGSWSDVYSLAAVCYLALTGITPIEWRQRGERHPLIPPAEVAPEIPAHVSDALLRALSVDLRTRYRTIDEFWVALLNEPGSGTMTYPLSVVKRSDPPDGPLPSPAASIGIRSLVVALVLTSLVAVIALGISYRIVDTQFPVPLPVQASAGLEPSSSEEDDDPQIYIPDLVGSNIEKVLLDPLYRSLFTFQIERVFSEAQPAGEILSQSPLAGTPSPSESPAQIRLWVCKGSQQIAMPDLVGMSLERAQEMLDSLEISYTYEPVEEPARKNGEIAAVSIPAGETVFRMTDTVILYVTENPEPEEDASGTGSSGDSSEYVYNRKQGTTETRPYFYQRDEES